MPMPARLRESERNAATAWKKAFETPSASTTPPSAAIRAIGSAISAVSAAAPASQIKFRARHSADRQPSGP